jgi:hypothetical protein
MKNQKTHLIYLIVSLLIMTGCMSQNDVTRIIAEEAEKIGKIQIGMSMSEVQNIMGTSMIKVGGSMEPRPIRRDKFLSKTGEPAEILFYRSTIKKADDVCTDDETTAVFLINGKVTVITSGDTPKSVIELRSR